MYSRLTDYRSECIRTRSKGDGQRKSHPPFILNDFFSYPHRVYLNHHKLKPLKYWTWQFVVILSKRQIGEKSAYSMVTDTTKSSISCPSPPLVQNKSTQTGPPI